LLISRLVGMKYIRCILAARLTWPSDAIIALVIKVFKVTAEMKFGY